MASVSRQLAKQVLDASFPSIREQCAYWCSRHQRGYSACPCGGAYELPLWVYALPMMYLHSAYQRQVITHYVPW